jgi:hypothetical protein
MGEHPKVNAETKDMTLDEWRNWKGAKIDAYIAKYGVK